MSLATSLDPLLARSMAPLGPLAMTSWSFPYSFPFCPARTFGFCLDRYDSPSITRS
jgi:hypothetical protein